MAIDQEVMLVGTWLNVYVHRVEWVLKLKGIQYAYVEEDISNKSPILLKYNPVKKTVPVLVHCGKSIAESHLIIEYIDETWKQNPIMPGETYERHMARFWAHFAEEKLTEGIKKALFAEGEEHENLLKQAMDAFEILEGELKGKKFFGGDSIGYLDIVLGWIAIWLGVVEEVFGFKVFNPYKNPALAKWMENFVNVPLIKANKPPKDKLVLHYQKLRQIVFSLSAK